MQHECISKTWEVFAGILLISNALLFAGGFIIVLITFLTSSHRLPPFLLCISKLSFAIHGVILMIVVLFYIATHIYIGYPLELTDNIVINSIQAQYIAMPSIAGMLCWSIVYKEFARHE